MSFSPGSAQQVHALSVEQRDQQAAQESGFSRNPPGQPRPGRKADEERHRGVGDGQIRSVRHLEGRGQDGGESDDQEHHQPRVELHR